MQSGALSLQEQLQKCTSKKSIKGPVNTAELQPQSLGETGGFIYRRQTQRKIQVTVTGRVLSGT